MQQLVAIARAISIDVRVLVLDEPTSSLDVDEVAELFRVMRDLTERGVAILFVSHFLEQVYEICDRITVLRGGRLVGEYVPSELLRIDLVQKMLGRSAAELGTRARVDAPPPEAVPIIRGEAITRTPGINGAGRRAGRGRGARASPGFWARAARSSRARSRASTDWMPASSRSAASRRI